MDAPLDCYLIPSPVADPRTHSPKPALVSNRKAWQRTAQLSSAHKDSHPEGIFVTGRKDNEFRLSFGIIHQIQVHELLLIQILCLHVLEHVGKEATDI